MKKILLFIFILSSIKITIAQDAAFLIYNSAGEQVSFDNMLTEVSNADFVFFGEYHNNVISHWMELKLVEALHVKKGQNLIIATEMFETDDQIILDEYLHGLIDKKNFEQEAKLWKNYKTDYEPIVEFAKDNQLQFVASNIPRRYAARVNKFGGLAALDSLSKPAKKLIAPLPIHFYKEIYMPMFMGMMGMHGQKGKTNESDMLVNMAEAQAVKDATMAYFSYKNWKKNKLVFHFNGSMHSDKYQGIITYLKKENAKLKIKTITTVTQKDIKTLSDNAKKKADFIICVSSDLTNSY